ncbi:glycine receptor subunit alpha-2-like [Branchiostoma floridae x Branchiostoma belcheri]
MAGWKVLLVWRGLALFFVSDLTAGGGGETSDDDRNGHDHEQIKELPSNFNWTHRYECHGKNCARWLDVTCAAHLLSFGAVSEATMDFQVSIQLVEQWRDPRVANLTKEERVPVAPEVEMWIPHVDFTNAKTTTVTTGEDETSMWVSRDGFINRALRYDIRASCPMNLQSFPLDKQRCKLKLDGVDDVRLQWGFPFIWAQDVPVVTDATALHSQFKLTGITTKAYVNSFLPNAKGKGCTYAASTCGFEGADDCLTDTQHCEDAVGTQECDGCQYFTGSCQNRSRECSLLETGDKNTFTTLEIQLHLSRRLAYHLLQMYIPSTSIVIMSWVSFWIDIAAVPARVCLGVTTVLTMTAQSGRTFAMPEVSYVRAIDVWIVVCQLFVFSALIEYAVVNFVYRFGGLVVRRPSNAKPLDHGPDDVTAVKIQQLKNPGDKGKRKAQTIDNACRVIFPSSFIVFNLVYWAVYLL